ncbi:MAG TPA: thioredoxin [Candidatus Babeliales bacterium]|jgi:thioredoxin 1|nr:thioredoxin [Candidatus Babeliales bacterium]
MPIIITQDNFNQEILQSAKPLILDVYASWCGPCQQMEPIINELEQEYKDLYTFAKLNVDEARDISIHYGVSSVPTFIFMKDGQVKGKETGYMGKERFREKIELYLG